ncbi:hypothetical protein AB0E85_34770 [Streptomyces sp. NPDC029044]|uniref:hypothetical protein n=1 Tax=Streptomyces sp. NPDC029044 TaxID=3157198 RepID=UPI003401F69F
MIRMASWCTPWGGAKDITLGDLLRHTSGIADHRTRPEAKRSEPTYRAGRPLDIWTV